MDGPSGNSKKRSRDNGDNSSQTKIEKPKRFLTAYNFFFMNERAAFLKSQSEEPPATEEADDPNLPASDSSKPWTKKTKRRHKKTHGKIDFKSLSKRVAAKWKGLSPQERQVYEDMAGDDLDRYKHEMKLYKKKVAAEEKRRVSQLPVPDQAKSATPLESSSSGIKKRSSSAGPMLHNKRELKGAVETSSSAVETERVTSCDFSCMGGELKNGRFIFQTNKLYGRNPHMSTIMDAYRKVGLPNNSSEVVLVAGYSGAGKSTLVQEAQKPITDMGGNFISGKFDRFRQMEPLSAIIVAFTEFCNEIATNGAEKLYRTKVAIQEKVGSEAAYLAKLIPCLRRVIEVPTTENIKYGGMESQNRLKYVFQLFARALAAPGLPLVLHLDDLQWADPFSLDLIESLVTDIENDSLLFIGSYRDNEVNETHLLTATLRNIENKQVNMNKISVGGLSREETNDLISDLIQTPPHFTQSLSGTVHRKTSGNVLFILQFLRSICDEGILYFSSRHNQWQWDTALIETKNIADNTAELMLRKILQLPASAQSALKMMACLGYCCEEFIISAMANANDIGNFGCTDLIASLELAAKEGLVDPVGSNFKFAHDQIQLAAYSLIPEMERGTFHLWIGTQVWANKSASPEKALFIVVGQLNKGAYLIKDPNQRVQLAGLNLEAAQKSKSLAAFVPAKFYLKTGIGLLNETPWRDHYDLCLQLYSSCAEAQYLTGDFEAMNKMLDEIFANARCLDDKIGAFFTLVSALLAQGKGQQASKVGCTVLSQLGESFPTYTEINSIIIVEFAKVKQMIQGKTDDEFLAMKVMEDKHKIAAMHLMNILALSAFLANQEVYALIILRMVQATLNHGFCDESAGTFASLGSLMCGVFRDVNGGYRFGQIALRLVERSQIMNCLPPVYCFVYTFIHPWVNHYRESLEPLKHAYEVGIRCGDISYAIASASTIYTISFICGEELGKMELMLKKYVQKMIEHKQEIYVKYCLPLWQTVVNLMGLSDDPSQLVGKAMDQDEILKDALENKRMRAAVLTYHLRSWFAYLFRDYDLAAEMTEKRQSIPLLSTQHFLSSNYLFVDGLISLEMAHKSDGTKWKTLALKAIQGMERYASYPKVNSQHKLFLLQAESDFLEGKLDSAERKYDEAIKAAGDNGFIQDQALAYERAGIFHSKRGNTSTASRFHGQAHNAYLKWGAKRKADHICHFGM